MLPTLPAELWHKIFNYKRRMDYDDRWGWSTEIESSKGVILYDRDRWWVGLKRNTWGRRWHDMDCAWFIYYLKYLKTPSSTLEITSFTVGGGALGLMSGQLYFYTSPLNILPPIPNCTQPGGCHAYTCNPYTRCACSLDGTDDGAKQIYLHLNNRCALINEIKKWGPHRYE